MSGNALIANAAHCPRSRVHRLPWIILALLVCVLWAPAHASELSTTPDIPGIDWEWVSRLNPELKVLVLIEADRPITLEDLAALADRGLKPADRDPGLVVGARSCVFATKLKKWMTGGPLPAHLSSRILERFVMSGIYRTAFRVEDHDYAGPLTLAVTAPRDGFGRKLLSSSYVVRPQTEGEIQVDEAGNKWLYVQYPEVRYGAVVRFHFAFKYLVDMLELLEHDLMLAPGVAKNEIPPDARMYLRPGRKIDPQLREAVDWAARAGQGQNLDVRSEYKRLTEYLKRNVTYDKQKRSMYFGGRSVYYDLDDMYQPIPKTLASRIGACPDTCLIECAFLRARGIPCRTAGRFGHFFSLVYVPGKGWMSTSVTPTGIPLIIAPGPDNVPHQRWRPEIPLRTTVWEARVRIEPVEE